MTEEKVVNSPETKKSVTDENERQRKKLPAEGQGKATSEEFEEEGMGVAPKE